MTSERAPFAALDDILRQARHLLIDFDGPICSLFAGTPTARVSDRLRKVITQQDVRLPPAIENSGNWFEILTFAASISPDLAASVEAELTEQESAAVTTAEPTPYIQDVLAACRESRHSIAVVSNNSTAAVRAYLVAHTFSNQITVIAARTGPDSAILKPNPHLIQQAASALGASPSVCAVIGDSPDDIQAARAAGASSIGYAKTQDDGDHLAVAEAGAIIFSMADLALRLRARAADWEL